MSNVKPIPEGYHTLTPHIVVRGAAEAIEFYKKAFGAEELCRMNSPNGNSVMHAELRIGDSPFMLCDESPHMKRWVAPPSLNGTTAAVMMYVPNVDKAFQRAVDAGATVSMPLMDTFWGDRFGKVTDPFGHEWELATHIQDLTPDEIAKGAEEFFAGKGTCEA